MVHPAALLVLWVGFAFALQWATFVLAVAVGAVCLAVALVFASRRSRNLLRRSRWLLLSLFVLLLFFTPGEYLPGIAGQAGITHEGLSSTGTHLGRLIAMLASLALLHERIGMQGLLAGFYWVLGGLGVRDATVVRLMLVLEQVERQEKTDWRNWLTPVAAEGGTEVLHLQMPPVTVLDRVLIGGTLLAMLAVGWLS